MYKRSKQMRHEPESESELEPDSVPETDSLSAPSRGYSACLHSSSRASVAWSLGSQSDPGPDPGPEIDPLPAASGGYSACLHSSSRLCLDWFLRIVSWLGLALALVLAFPRYVGLGIYSRLASFSIKRKVSK